MRLMVCMLCHLVGKVNTIITKACTVLMSVLMLDRFIAVVCLHICSTEKTSTK